jgi:pyruvate formate lyase activating enzyme
MLLGGLQKFSLLDYPGHVSAIIFTQGCNFRCSFCYNPMLVWPVSGEGKSKYDQSASANEAENEVSDETEADRSIKDHSLIQENDLLSFLRERSGKLDAVVITGGEPTTQADLPVFLGKIRKLGYLIKLDTNGTNPEMIRKLLDEKLIDYLAMDLKAPFAKYQKVTGVKADLDKIKKSIKIIRESGLPYEFRTTATPGLLELEDIREMAETLKGAEKWYIQKFNPDTDLVNPIFQQVIPYPEEIMEKMRNIGQSKVRFCGLR